MSKIILGGGLSGLSAAHYALNKFPKEIITLIEKSDRLGGWLRSTRQEDGSIFEQAARTIRPRGALGANTLRLIHDLELDDQIVPIPSSSPAALNRMIYANGKLHTLPSSLAGIFKKQDPFSKPLFRLLLNDVFAPRKKLKENDESLYNFIHRRFGSEMADYLISPLICGICGGDAKEISVKFLLSSIFEKEQRYGSITRGIIADVFKRKESDKVKRTPLELRAKREKWSVYSFKNGMEQLPRALTKNISKRGAQIKLNEEIQEIEVYKKSVALQTKDGKVHVGNHLISSIPALRFGPLIKTQHPYLADILSSFKTASMCVINLKYDKKLIQNEGFGFLVAPKENLPLLGVIYDSCCFPRDDTTILTVMMGGYKFDKYFNARTTDEEVLTIATTELKRTLGISDPPDRFNVSILRECIPQYTVGHYEKVKRIHDYIKDNYLALSLCGASYHGVGVNDVILSAKNAIDDI